HSGSGVGARVFEEGRADRRKVRGRSVWGGREEDVPDGRPGEVARRWEAGVCGAGGWGGEDTGGTGRGGGGGGGGGEVGRGWRGGGGGGGGWWRGGGRGGRGGWWGMGYGGGARRDRSKRVLLTSESGENSTNRSTGRAENGVEISTWRDGRAVIQARR